ncbi:MAG: hypothetical protein ACLQBB_07180 [Solirubrobacteraceae bacterium]
MTAEDDLLLGFLERFASMSEDERDAAIDALPPRDRDALLALADARARTAQADLIAVLDAGQDGLEKLYGVAAPTDLYTVIHLAAAERPQLLVEALFAAVVLHRGWDQEPAEIVALREGWHWHVHEQVTATQARRQGDRLEEE